MTSPDDPLRHVEGDPFWREAREGAQAASPESQEAWREALGPPLIVSRWLPGEDIDPSEVRGIFQQDPTQDYGRWTAGPSIDEQDQYAQMRERLQRLEGWPNPALPSTPITTESMIRDDVQRALMGGASMETVQARLRELGFEYHGILGPEGIQQSYDVSASPVQDTEDVYAAIRAVGEEAIAVPLEDLPNLPWSGEVRIVGHDVERNMVDVEFTRTTPVDRNADPMTAIRTRPLAGGGAGGGYARQSTTWAGSSGGIAGGGGDSLRERLMRHGVTPPPDLDVGVEVAAQSAPAEPRWLEPAPARRAQAHMDEIFAELDTKSKGELLDLIADMRKDWKMLNEIHNSRANRSSWCVEYEERQEIHNQKLRVLKLIGRIYDGPTDNENEGRGL